MNNLTKNEIITLKHLADGQQHKDTPSAISDAQFYMALKSLQAKDMVYAGFCEGGVVESCMIITAGQAVLDDMRSVERRILWNLLDNEGLTQDQFDLLQYAMKTGKCENIFDIPWNDYKEQILLQLDHDKLIQTSYDQNEKIIKILTRLGQQKIERIEDELYNLLSDDIEEEMQEEQKRETSVEEIHEVKDSGFRINEDRITDVIKTVWSMHDIGMFVDNNGNKPTVKSVMDAFAEFLKAKQFEQYSSYMNKALKTTKNTYLNVFYEMANSAEKHYIEKKQREISK